LLSIGILFFKQIEIDWTEKPKCTP
jgi:hypothetical protein